MSLPYLNRYYLSSRRSLTTDRLPVSIPSNIQIARRSKATLESALLNNTTTNGFSHEEIPALGTKRKRSVEDTIEVDPQKVKKSKVQGSNGPSNDVDAVIIDDSGGDGAIIIEDD